MMNWSNYKKECRIIGRFIIGIKIWMLTVMMKKVNMRSRSIMHLI